MRQANKYSAFLSALQGTKASPNTQAHVGTKCARECSRLALLLLRLIQRSQQHWPIATVSLDTCAECFRTSSDIAFGDNCRCSEAAAQTSVICALATAQQRHTLNRVPMWTECSRHGWESQRRKHSELETEALCHPSTEHYSDGNNEHLTANVSSITTAQCHHCIWL